MESPQSQLKLLVAKGKEQGYLTYAEVNDHLPQDIVDSDQVEDIIQMINDMGIQVFESAPDADELLMAETTADEEVAEAQVAAVQAAQNTIPKGRYMFQLGAYQSQAQAVQMQRKAQQNGMNTRVETANINGKKWFRVRLGPTDNLQTVNKWKQRLSGMGINPMMIRL